MMRLAVSTILFASSILKANAQDTAVLQHAKPKFFRAASELAMAQVLPWSYNRYIRKAEFAKVSFASISNNLKPSSWEWDDNRFATNQFAHPYHGNLYFNSFRTNGYSFWQSVPAAFAGSFIWETAGETHRPAPNDFINTSVGGIVLGEMTYRISNRIINTRSRGAKRQLQELTALLINPMNGLNRILDGRWGRTGPDTDSGTVATTLLDIGVRQFDVQSLQGTTRGTEEFYLRLRVDNGDKFKASHIPFESFSIWFEAGAGDSTYINALEVNGALKTWKMREDSNSIHLYRLSVNYDFIKNIAFEYGAQSVQVGIVSDWNRNSDTRFHTAISGGLIILGAVPDKYLFYGEGRNYDYGPGISVAASAGIQYKNHFSAELNYRGGRFQTVDGNRSSFILNTMSAEARAMLPKRFSLAVALGQFTLNGYYKSYKNVSERYPFFRFSLGYFL